MLMIDDCLKKLLESIEARHNRIQCEPRTPDDAIDDMEISLSLHRITRDARAISDHIQRADASRPKGRRRTEGGKAARRARRRTSASHLITVRARLVLYARRSFAFSVRGF
jgi:hypothetical protein